MTTSDVAFEVERFEWTATDRLEIEGRWFGLRGHRFMRPALVVDAGDGRRRMLALLEHKPWAADDGETWTAAFTWEGQPVDLAAAELSVAPSLAVELPPARPPGPRRRGGAATPRKGAGARTAPRVTAHAEGRNETLARELAEARDQIARLEADRDRAADARRRELAELRTALGAERDAAGALRARVDQAEQDLRERADAGAEGEALAAERDAVVAERDAVAAERDRARARADGLDRELEEIRARHEELRRALAAADREREAARREPAAPDPAAMQALARERDAAIRERDVTRRERDELSSRIDATIAARDAAVSERDAAVSAGRAAVAERDTAVAERETARAERDAAIAERETARAERDTAVADRAADPPVDRLRPPTRASAADRRVRGGRQPATAWGPRVVAVAVLGGLVVVLAVLLGVV